MESPPGRSIRAGQVIDKVLVNCEQWARDFSWGHLPAEPSLGLVVVACMDSRQPLKKMLGLEPGTAHFIRNAGGLVTEDVLRSLLISVHLKGAREIMIIEHTHCGMLGLRDSDFQARLERDFGAHPHGPTEFGGFHSLDENVRAQVHRVRSHPWFPREIPVRGFIYDVENGRMTEVQ